MSLLLNSPLLSQPSTRCWKSKQEVRLLSHGPSIGGMCRTIYRTGKRNGNGIKAFFFNPEQDPIVKEALKPSGSIHTRETRILDALATWNARTSKERNPDQTFVLDKEPVAFLGGMFAGILRLDLNEEPLKEWVTRTVEAAGISEEEVNTEESTTEAAPQEIQIE